MGTLTDSDLTASAVKDEIDRADTHCSQTTWDVIEDILIDNH